MHKLRRKLTYANVVATLALIVAVAGGSTAVAVTANASKKKTDVNKKGNIRAGRVTAKKLANGNVTAAKLAGIDIVQAHRCCPVPTQTARAASDCSAAGRRLTQADAALYESAPVGKRMGGRSHGERQISPLTRSA